MNFDGFIERQPLRVRATLKYYIETGDLMRACKIANLNISAFKTAMESKDTNDNLASESVMPFLYKRESEARLSHNHLVILKDTYYWSHDIRYSRAFILERK